MYYNRNIPYLYLRKMGETMRSLTALQIDVRSMPGAEARADFLFFLEHATLRVADLSMKIRWGQFSSEELRKLWLAICA